MIQLPKRYEAILDVLQRESFEYFLYEYNPLNRLVTDKTKDKWPACIAVMAERGRFELPEPVKVQQFSRLPQSTTLPPLRDKLSLPCAAFGLRYAPACVANISTTAIFAISSSGSPWRSLR